MSKLVFNDGHYVNQDNIGFLCGLGMDLDSVKKTLETLSLASKKYTTLIFSILVTILVILTILLFILIDPGIAACIILFEFSIFIGIIILDIRSNQINRKILNFILDTQINSKQSSYRFSAGFFCYISAKSTSSLSVSERNFKLVNYNTSNDREPELERVVFFYLHKEDKYDPGVFRANEDCLNMLKQEEIEILNQMNFERIKFNDSIFCKALGYSFLVILLYTGLLFGLIYLILSSRMDTVPLLISMYASILISIGIFISLLICINNHLSKPFYERMDYLNNENYKNKGVYTNIGFMRYYLFSFKLQDVDLESPGTVDINGLPKPPAFEQVKMFIEKLLS